MTVRVLVAMVLALTTAAVAPPASAQQLAGFDPSSRAASIDTDIARVIQEIERKESEKARVDAEIDGLGERRAAARERLHRRTAALYRIRRAGLLPLAGGIDALLGHQARVERLTRMVESDLRALESLQTRGDVLRAQTGDLARELEEARRSLTALRQRKQTLHEERRMASIFDSAFEPSGVAAPSPHGTPYGELRFSDGREPTFASQRGRLALPIAGAADVRQGVRDGAAGLEFLAAPGTTVLAAADGHVVFTGPHGAYGTVVIVDHGDSYYSVYGGLGGVDVGAGSHVRRGTRIGDIGSGYRPALFFEVRRGTSPLSAEDWLGL